MAQLSPALTTVEERSLSLSTSVSLSPPLPLSVPPPHPSQASVPFRSVARCQEGMPYLVHCSSGGRRRTPGVSLPSAGCPASSLAITAIEKGHFSSGLPLLLELLSCQIKAARNLLTHTVLNGGVHWNHLGNIFFNIQITTTGTKLLQWDSFNKIFKFPRNFAWETNIENHHVAELGCAASLSKEASTAQWLSG